MKTQSTSSCCKIFLWLPIVLVVIAALAAWLMLGGGRSATSQSTGNAMAIAKPVAAGGVLVATTLAKANPQTVATATATASGPDAAAKAERKMGDAQAMAALMNNPAMKSMRAAQMSSWMQMTYHDLMEHLQLSPDESTYFQNLLTDKELSREQLGTQMLNPSLSADQRDEIHQQLIQADQGFDGKIQQFLNNDADYAYYQTYAQQSSERAEVGAFESTLAGQGEPINADQADTLANLMYDARQDFPFTVDFYNEKNWGNPQIMNQAAVDKFVAEQAQYQGQVATQAASLLTPAQLDAFRQNQTAMAQMMKMRLGYVVQMVNGQ
jgi:hypothetical protein